MLFYTKRGSVSMAPEDIWNIGFVLYAKSDMPGTLNAKWKLAEITDNALGGTGIATGGPKEGFAGSYRVQYFDEAGKPSGDALNLAIEKIGDFYNVRWNDITNGDAIYRGVGMQVEDGLAVGWRGV
jgi:hypothetical protein